MREDLLALYRKRGKAEGHLGELMSVVAPALSSTSHRKSHYRGRKIAKREKGVDAFACNEVRLLARQLRLPRSCMSSAPCRARAPRPGPLHRLGPPDHDDHRRRVGALAHARPPDSRPCTGPPDSGAAAQAPTPSPGPGGREDAEVSGSAGNRLGPAEQLPIRTRKAWPPEPHRPALGGGDTLDNAGGCERSLSLIGIPDGHALCGVASHRTRDRAGAIKP